jgi:hypothetical protein
MVSLPGCVLAQTDSTVARDDLPPAGYGTLRQDDVSLRLRTPTLQVQVVPLDEHVIRLLATDTYQSLHRLVESKSADVSEAASRFGMSGPPTLFLVTFFGLQASARFDPEVITVESQNRLFRPVAVLPLSPRWSGQQLGQRETASAIYLFESGVRILDPLVLSYESARTDAWEQIIRTLERERTSVLARAARGGR